jgi:excisionase family DNA binding protein
MNISEGNNLQMYSEREAAKVLGVSVANLRRKAESGEIKYVLWGSHRRYPHFYLEEWLREQLTNIKDRRE